eukprot:CAMPEP_0119127176 /NCGR_PEP_ID=MMETSP1310-20130426/5827_1 /TAXON_ID=464262 /ORGANISM="Genus nov. species nov., Strain RCC2339" /LENGTH=217 /DNA_ID=CAMNT_0007117413 /DNA_START=29 /DNA_END=678 /DNA_ORIENTATION=-
MWKFVVFGAMAVYVGFAVVNVAMLWFPATCPEGGRCVKPSVDLSQPYDLELYLLDPALKGKLGGEGPVWTRQNVGLKEDFEVTMQLKVPPWARAPVVPQLSALFVLHPSGVTARNWRRPASNAEAARVLQASLSLFQHRLVQDRPGVYLLDDLASASNLSLSPPRASPPDAAPVPHFRNRVTLRLVADGNAYPFDDLPQGVEWKLLSLAPGTSSRPP